MPQMDVLTFPGQVTWFMGSFTVYYLLAVAFLLPVLGTALKVRGAKLNVGRSQISRYDEWMSSLNESMGESFGQMSDRMTSAVGLHDHWCLSPSDVLVSDRLVFPNWNHMIYTRRSLRIFFDRDFDHVGLHPMFAGRMV